jgi:hypothetical protein
MVADSRAACPETAEPAALEGGALLEPEPPDEVQPAAASTAIDSAAKVMRTDLTPRT